jgi:hypothetical protein
MTSENEDEGENEMGNMGGEVEDEDTRHTWLMLMCFSDT